MNENNFKGNKNILIDINNSANFDNNKINPNYNESKLLKQKINKYMINRNSDIKEKMNSLIKKSGNFTMLNKTLEAMHKNEKENSFIKNENLLNVFDNTDRSLNYLTLKII